MIFQSNKDWVLAKEDITNNIKGYWNSTTKNHFLLSKKDGSGNVTYYSEAPVESATTAQENFDLAWTDRVAESTHTFEEYNVLLNAGKV